MHVKTRTSEINDYVSVHSSVTNLMSYAKELVGIVENMFPFVVPYTSLLFMDAVLCLPKTEVSDADSIQVFFIN